LGAVLWHIDLSRVGATLSRLEPTSACVVLLPSVLIYLSDTVGWHLTLPPDYAKDVSLARLFVIRMAGETVNLTTPTAYLGGEPLKSYWLHRYGVPLMDASVSVVVAKTTMTIAQILYILLGVGVGVWLVGRSTGPNGLAAEWLVGIGASLLALALLLSGAIAMVVLQRRGLFSLLFGLKRRTGFRSQYLEARETSFLAFDEAVRSFYRSYQRAAWLSTACFLFGWLLESVEVYAILYGLGLPIDPLRAIAIGGIAVGIKGGGFFIPGSLGIQDGGNVLLLLMYGYSDATGMAFAILRRMREVVWIGIGMGCLLGLRFQSDVSKSENN
jgi:glycosyltransferase 2 family protein